MQGCVQELSACLSAFASALLAVNVPQIKSSQSSTLWRPAISWHTVRILSSII